MSWYLQALKKYAVMHGRARRREFWTFALVNWVIFSLLSVMGRFDALAEAGLSNPGLVAAAWGEAGVLASVFWLAMLVPGVAVSVRRLHDTGRSGWWTLVAIVPLLNLLLLAFLLLDSEPGDNAYGSNPKGVAIPAT